MVLDGNRNSQNKQTKIIDERLYDKYIKNNIGNVFDKKMVILNENNNYLDNDNDIDIGIRRVKRNTNNN